MKEINIEIEDYSYTCGDGCCTDYGTKVTINGQELDCRNQDLPTQIDHILQYLGYKVNLVYKYNGEEL